ncbi:MAG: hypothetical protein JSU79_03525 [Dehalococcoidales bacterium]|nr:MAG: hypothetical protein JSU79_03525 [Dehalococcoidales bacterium]
MTSIYVSLGILCGVALLILGITMWRTRNWAQGQDNPPLKGLALPEGSVRALVAFLLIGSFIIFIFLGKEAVVIEWNETKQLENGTTEIVPTQDTTLYNTILTAFGTLTGTVTGFYFAKKN